MPKSFTLEDLAKYSSDLSDASHRGLTRKMKRQGPSALAISNILQYSRVLAVSATHSGGHLFMLMN